MIVAWQVAQSLPTLSARLVEMALPVALFSLQWFMCLFAKDLPLSLTLRVWDVLFVYGDRTITYLLTYGATHLRNYSPTYLLTYVPAHLRTCSPTHLLTQYSPTYLPTYLLTYLLTGDHALFAFSLAMLQLAEEELLACK